MIFPIFQFRAMLTLAICLLTAAPAPSQPKRSTSERMAELTQAPEAAGILVYRGETFAQRSNKGAPLFRYERRVLVMPNTLNASHLTSDPLGRLIIVESAIASPDYELQQFEATNLQSGLSGTVKVSQSGRRLEFELNDNGKSSKASEDVSAPVVTGPSMFGFILKNWDALLAGAALPVRMLVIQEKTTYGFDIKLEMQSNGQASFAVTPSSFLIRMAIKPLRVVFDTHTKMPIRYEGRVPPMQNVSGQLKNLDARVEYTSMTAKYH